MLDKQIAISIKKKYDYSCFKREKCGFPFLIKVSLCVAFHYLLIYGSKVKTFTTNRHIFPLYFYKNLSTFFVISFLPNNPHTNNIIFNL